MSDKIIDRAIAKLEQEAIYPYRSLQPRLCVIHKTTMESGEESYLKMLQKVGNEYGAFVDDVVADTPAQVAEGIQMFATKPSTHGIIIISDYGNMNRVLYNMIPVRLDIDSLSALSLGNLVDNISPIAYRNAPCTAVACMKIMEELNKGDSFDGQSCLVIGRSIRVGRPLTEILIQKNMTVTMAHSKTNKARLDMYSDYDYIVSAIGKPNYWNGTTDHEFYIPPCGRLNIIDVGMNIDEEGNLCGDIDREWIKNKGNDQIYITPVTGGVGRMTTTVLFSKLFNNAAEFFKNSAGLYQEPPQRILPPQEGLIQLPQNQNEVPST